VVGKRGRTAAEIKLGRWDAVENQAAG